MGVTANLFLLAHIAHFVFDFLDQRCQPNQTVQCKTQSFPRRLSTKGKLCLANQNELLKYPPGIFFIHCPEVFKYALPIFNSPPLLPHPSHLKKHFLSPTKDSSQAEECFFRLSMSHPQLKDMQVFPAVTELHLVSRSKGFALNSVFPFSDENSSTKPFENISLISASLDLDSEV